MPVGFQITQQEAPLASGGVVTLRDKDGKESSIRIARIQLEQDSGKSIHDVDPTSSLVDLNRAGVGLMEIVSEPDMDRPEEAVAYIKKIQSYLRHIGSCNGNMEEGSLRCDINVSVRLEGEGDDLIQGARCEVKNLNSLRSVHRAIDYEVVRHVKKLEAGEEVPMETRTFDAAENVTRRLRSKEEQVDYRFMPEPDLPVLKLSQAAIDDVASKLPELPEALMERLM